uniref:MurR/RpiR family transcriptional regulator n=1 Tax=Microbacterium azadirachtae TaxID=582680 RepID=UPI0015872E32|nr:MurR/RpiR family transcriptional regulator [Microbacterium azadirachtae]
MTSSASALISGEFVARAQTALRHLGSTDKRVVEAILDNPHAIIEGSVTELALRAGVAQSSAVRTCQRLGYRGYQDIKIAITRDLARQGNVASEIVHDEGIDDGTEPGEILSQILHRSGRALEDAIQTVSSDAFATVVERIASANRLLVIGNGTSAAPSQDAAYRFMALGLIVSSPSDVIAQHLASKQLDPSDVCVVVSHTGSSRDSLRAAQSAAAAGAYVVAITSFASSPLTKVADASLIAGGPDYGFRLEAMASRLAHLGVIDALFVAIAVRRPAKSNKALDIMADITIEHSL